MSDHACGVVFGIRRTLAEAKVLPILGTDDGSKMKERQKSDKDGVVESRPANAVYALLVCGPAETLYCVALPRWTSQHNARTAC